MAANLKSSCRVCSLLPGAAGQSLIYGVEPSHSADTYSPSFVPVVYLVQHWCSAVPLLVLLYCSLVVQLRGRLIKGTHSKHNPTASRGKVQEVGQQVTSTLNSTEPCSTQPGHVGAAGADWFCILQCCYLHLG
jgi:hypothetical protein